MGRRTEVFALSQNLKEHTGAPAKVPEFSPLLLHRLRVAMIAAIAVASLGVALRTFMAVQTVGGVTRREFCKRVIYYDRIRADDFTVPRY